MARLLRSTGVSKLRPPAVTGDPITFRGVVVKHAAVKPRTDYAQRHFAHSNLKPPAVVTPIAVFMPGPILKVLAPSTKLERERSRSDLKPPAVVGASITFAPVVLTLAPSPNQARASHPNLSPPTVLAASIVFAPISKTLARTPRPPYAAHSRLYPPAVLALVAFIAAPVKLMLAVLEQARRQQARSELRPPTVVAASIVFRPVQRLLAWQFPRPAAADTHYKLSPPVVFPAAFIAAAVRVSLAVQRTIGEKRIPRSVLRVPTVVAASIVFRPIQRVLAWTFPRPATGAHSELRPPTITGAVVAAILAPIKVILVAVAAARRPKYRSKLNAPTVVGASIVFAPIRRMLAWQRPPAGTRSELRPPASTVAAFIAAPIKLVMVAVQVASKRRTYRSIIRPPAVVAAVALALPIHLTLVAVRTAVDLIRRRPKSKLKPPTSVDPSTVFPPVDARLAPSGRQARATHSSLKGPTAVSGATVFAPIRRKLALQVPRQGRQTHSKLRLPIFKAPDIIAGAVSIVDTVLSLVGLSDAPGSTVDVADATGAEVQMADSPDAQASAADGTGDDVTIDDYPA